MQSRRNFIGNVATGLAGTLAAGNALGANERIRLGIIGPGARGTEILQQALACENVECIGAADVYTRRLEDVKKHRAQRQDVPRLSPPARGQGHRRGPDRHPAAPALRTLHRRHRRRQARLPGKDHGVHRGPRQAHARRLPEGRRQARRTDRPSVDLHRRHPGRHQLQQARTDGQDHRDPRPHVPQHAARQAAVVAPRLSRHDAGKHHLEELPGRSQTGGLRRQPLHQLALLLGLLRRQRLREHVPPAFLLVQGAGPQDSPRRHHDRRHLPVEGRPRSARHHERHHGARRGDALYLGFRLRQRSAARHRRRARRQRHHLAHAADHQVLPRKRSIAKTATK